LFLVQFVFYSLRFFLSFLTDFVCFDDLPFFLEFFCF